MDYNRWKVVLACFLLVAALIGAADVAAGQSGRVAATVLKVSANQAGDGYLVETSSGVFPMAYGAGGYGRFDRIYSRILQSMEQKRPVTLILGKDGIEDALD